MGLGNVDGRLLAHDGGLMFRVTAKTDERDLGWKRFQANLKRINGSHVTVGVHQDAGTYGPGKANVAQVAFWNEFGTRFIPMRSFIRGMLVKNETKLNDLRAKLLEKVFGLEITWDQALDTLGFMCKQWMMNMIQSNIPPSNSGATLRRKRKFGQPARTLIASGLLLRSIEFKKVKK